MVNVLPFRPQPQAGSFTLREVVGSDCTGEISRWFASNRAARAKFRVRINHLRGFPRTEWNKKQFRSVGDGLWEIKWKSADKQFRAIGFDRQGAFILLIGCTHKDDVYGPPNCLKTAQKLKKEVEDGQRKSIEFTP